MDYRYTSGQYSNVVEYSPAKDEHALKGSMTMLHVLPCSRASHHLYTRQHQGDGGDQLPMCAQKAAKQTSHAASHQGALLPAVYLWLHTASRAHCFRLKVYPTSPCRLLHACQHLVAFFRQGIMVMQSLAT